MADISSIRNSPYTGGVLAVLSVFWEAFWLIGPPVGVDASTRKAYLLWGLLAIFLSFSYAFITQQKKIRDYETSKVVLVFDSRDSQHAQHGKTTRPVSGGQEYGNEYIYAIGVVNLSRRPIVGCSLKLVASKPHRTSEQRLGRALRVRGDSNQGKSNGEFTVNPSDIKSPGAYIEVLQEFAPDGAGMAVQSDIRVRYANTLDATEHWFTQRNEHTLTFKLEGTPKPILFVLVVDYDSKKRRWDVRGVDGI